MYLILTIVGGVLGLIVTGALVYMVWQVATRADRARLQNWTVMDYIALGVFVIGTMLLFADLIAVMRDKASYPFYHYGYLFASFVFMVSGMAFMTVRLGTLLARPASLRTEASEDGSSLPYEHGQPYQADQAE